MSDFEDRIRMELRHEPAVPDEAFVSLVSGRVEASAKRRAVALAIATVLATGLAGGMIASIAATWPLIAAWLPQGIRLVPDDSFALIATAGPAPGVLVVAALLVPLAQLRR